MQENILSLVSGYLAVVTRQTATADRSCSGQPYALTKVAAAERSRYWQQAELWASKREIRAAKSQLF
jgi:hypothetical protein